MKIRPPRTARALAASGVIALAASCLLLSVSSADAATVKPASSSSAPAGSCPAGATCVTIPSPCPAGSTCPTVEAEPTGALNQNEWIYLNLSNYPVGSTVDIYFCSDNSPLTMTSAPHCVLEGTPDFTYPSQQLPIGTDGTGETSFQTIDDPHQTGNTALIGEIPGDTSAKPLSFYCGDAKDNCSVDIVDSSVLSTQPSNPAIPLPTDTAVIPLGYAAQDNGCAKASQVTTYSDFSIDQLIPHESPVACASSDPAIAVNTATSTDLILPFLQSGNVLFVDDPQAADIQAALHKVHYSVVPIAASAVVMGYVAAMKENGINWPFHAFELTPNEVAGLVSYNYQGPFDGDVVKCSTGQCSAMEDLNSVSGFVAAGEYGSFIPSEVSGVTETLTNWICNAPNVPFTLNGQTITDPNLATKTLTTSIDYPKTWPIKSCTATDQLPPLPTPAAGLFNMASDPSHQIKYLRTFAPPPQFQLSPVAGFAPMDWGDARYNGLDVATLQNADGEFVAPTATSVQAEVAAETLSSSGYLLPDPGLKVNGGYPLSTVIDALVPDSPLPAALAGPTGHMLQELLNYTTSAAQLPDGYVALPKRLATASELQLQAALKAENAPTSLPTTTSVTASPSTTGVGKPVKFSVTVKAATGTPTGTVDVDFGPKVLCTVQLSAGKGSCTSASLPVGLDLVRGGYLGTGGYEASNGSTTLTVSKPAGPPATTTTTTTTTTVPFTTVAATTVPPTTAPPATVPPTTSPRAPGTTLSSKPRLVGLADVTLAQAAVGAALPFALAIGLALLGASLALSIVGKSRRRRDASSGGASA